jgi:hypothetical protein
LLIALIATGCVSVPELRDPPDWGEVADFEKAEAADPQELPDLCEIEVVETEFGRRGSWSLECWEALSAYEIVADENLNIARSNTNALRTTESAVDALVRAGQLERELSNFYLEMLRDERVGRKIDVTTYRVLMALIAIGAAAL